MTNDSVARTVQDLQASFEAFLARAVKADPKAAASIIPPGFRIAVELRYASNKRKIKHTADASNWSPATGIVVLTCTPDAAVMAQPEPRLSDATSCELTEDKLSDLVLALDEAQRDARYREFVGLKHFRDEYLPKKGFPWCESLVARREVLHTAIERGMIVKGSVRNPRTPEFSTTSISVNKGDPGVHRILQAHVIDRSPFHPVPIRGEGLSQTITRDRR
jgi:hypothetical protein